MGEVVWWIVLPLMVLGNPVVAGAGIIVGLLARRRLHVLIAVPIVPLSSWLFQWALYRTEPDHSWTMLPLMAGAGLIWAGTSFALKRACTSA